MVVCCYEGQLFINDLVVNGEDEIAYSNDGPSRAICSDIIDLNKNRQMQSIELQAVLSQLAVLWKHNTVLTEELIAIY